MLCHCPVDWPTVNSLAALATLWLLELLLLTVTFTGLKLYLHLCSFYLSMPAAMRVSFLFCTGIYTINSYAFVSIFEVSDFIASHHLMFHQSVYSPACA